MKMLTFEEILNAKEEKKKLTDLLATCSSPYISDCIQRTLVEIDLKLAKDEQNHARTHSLIDALRVSKVAFEKTPEILAFDLHFLLQENGFKVDEGNDLNKVRGNWEKVAYERDGELYNLSCKFKQDGKIMNVELQNSKTKKIFAVELEATSFVDVQSKPIEDLNSVIKATEMGHFRDLIMSKISETFQKCTSDEVKPSGYRSTHESRFDVDNDNFLRKESTSSEKFLIPEVGRSDAFPSFLQDPGNNAMPGNLVGPNHPIFGMRDPAPQGPFPGARFDPYGPPGGPGGISNDPFRGGNRSNRPPPQVPFGMPNPDHLRAPRDNSSDPPFGYGDMFS